MKIFVCILFFPFALLAQTDVSGQPVPVNFYDALSQAKTSAVQAIPMIKDQLLDPTSFTLLKVYVIIGTDKKHPDKPPYWYGCVRYVGSNRMGGREQTWGLYSIDNKSGKLKASASEPSQLTFPCNMIRKKEISVEVTADVKKLIANGPPD